MDRGRGANAREEGDRRYFQCGSLRMGDRQRQGGRIHHKMNQSSVAEGSEHMVINWLNMKDESEYIHWFMAAGGSHLQCS